MNDAEQETIGLCIALEAIDDIVNHALLDISDSGVAGEATVLFKERVHQQMFLVRLLDFSKETGSKSVTGVAGSCLDVLREACRTRAFDVDNSVAGLDAGVTALQDWLEATSSVRMWIPTLNVEAQLTVPRSQLVFILIDTSPSAEAVLLARERVARLGVCLGRLPEKTRTLFLSHRIDGRTYPQLAREHDLTVSAVEKHVAKALLQLTTWMEAW